MPANETEDEMRVNGSVLRLIMCGAMLAACSDDSDDVVVRAHTDPNADFASYKTFAFTTVADADAGTLEIPGDVSANLAVVNSAVKDQLEQEGLTEVAADESPDVLAFSLSSTRDETARSWVCAPGYWYGYWDDGYGDPCAVMEPTYTEYTEGTVAVGLIDPALGRTVFGGVAKGVIEGDENDIQREVDSAVEKIFDDYPKDQTGDGN
jgi:hypothetical protein